MLQPKGILEASSRSPAPSANYIVVSIDLDSSISEGPRSLQQRLLTSVRLLSRQYRLQAYILGYVIIREKRSWRLSMTFELFMPAVSLNMEAIAHR